MKYSIERVEWKDAGALAGEVLSHNFPTPVARYEWLHAAAGNPAGPGALWLARAADGRPIGTAAVHARRVLVHGRPYRAGLAADFAVERAARAFGPALALQQAVAAACDSGEFAFLFGFPNRAARAVFERVGYRLGRTRRLARPLSTAPYLRRCRGLASAGRFLAIPLDLAMRLVSRETYRFPMHGPELEPVDDFDESFDAFWTRVQPQDTVVADRDSQYLNWRYGTCPTRRYERAMLRRGREVIGTLVWYRIGDVAYVAEMLAADPPSFDALLEAFLRAQRRAGAAAVSLIVLGDAPFMARLATYGFFPRPVERTMMVYVPSSSGAGLDHAERWCLFEGDIL